MIIYKQMDLNKKYVNLMDFRPPTPKTHSHLSFSVNDALLFKLNECNLLILIFLIWELNLKRTVQHGLI